MSLYRRPGSSTWYVKIYHGGKELRRSTGTADKRQAQEYHDKVKSDLWAQQRLGHEPARGWAEACVRWLREHTHKRSLNDDKEKLRWLTARLQGFDLNDITLDTVEALIAEKSQEPARRRPGTASNATVNRHTAVLSAILHAAKSWGWIKSVPHIRKLQEPKRRVRYLTRDELVALISQLPLHLAYMATFALTTGLREANVVGLTWAQVDLERGVAWIHADQAKGGVPIAVPLSAEAAAVVRDQVGVHPSRVFTFRERPVTRMNNHAWAKALKRAGIENFRVHDLRHSFASWHAMAGTPMQVLQELGGWKDQRMVQKYAHLSPSHLAGFAGNLKPPTL